MIKYLITELERNKTVFHNLLNGTPEAAYRWKQTPDKWCLLEIICHLYDEEREDFRVRLGLVLETPEVKPPPFNPEKWVTERKYMEQNFQEKLQGFLEEREQSLQWLRSLENPQWSNAYQHPKYGSFSAKFYLTNWLAHDCLHIRQITRLKYDYLQHISGESVRYAGEWK